MFFQRVHIRLSGIQTFPQSPMKEGFASLPWELTFHIFQMIADVGTLNACSLVSKEMCQKVADFKASILTHYWEIEVTASGQLAHKVTEAVRQTLQEIEKAKSPEDFNHIQRQMIVWERYLAQDGWNQMFSKRSTVFSVLCCKLVDLDEKVSFHNQYLRLLEMVCRSSINYNLEAIAAPPLLAVIVRYAQSETQALYYKALFAILLKGGADPLKIYQNTIYSKRATCVCCRLQRDRKKVLLKTARQYVSVHDLRAVHSHSCNTTGIKEVLNLAYSIFLLAKSLG